MMKFLCGSETRFFEFMSNLDEKDRVAILTHTDADGMCSAVIAGKVLGKVDFIKFVNYTSGVYSELARIMKKNKINKILILDLVVDGEREAIKEMEKFAEVLIIDHHPFSIDLNSERTISLKAESKYPATYMCYYLFSKMQKISGWIAAIGILGDLPHKYFKENYKQVFKDFSLGEPVEVWVSVEDVNFALAYLENDRKRVYDFLMNAKSISNLELKEYADPVRDEFNLILQKYDKEKEVYGNLVFFNVDSKYPIKYLLVNRISSDNQDKTFVFTKKNPDHLSISARSQKIDCNSLMSAALKGIPDSFAGGHKSATGGRIPHKYLEKFKENLVKEYRKLK